MRFVIIAKARLPMRNVARDKPAIQSSTFNVAYASRAVDGQRNSGGVISCTNGDVHSWWAVDLRERFLVKEVTIITDQNVAKCKLSHFTGRVATRSTCRPSAIVAASHALPRGTRSSDILQNPHWLPIDQRIEFQLATLTYNILNSSQPAYLRSLLNYHTPTRSLRSANTNLLSVPRVRTTFASRGFSIAAPTV